MTIHRIPLVVAACMLFACDVNGPTSDAARDNASMDMALAEASAWARTHPDEVAAREARDRALAAVPGESADEQSRLPPCDNDALVTDPEAAEETTLEDSPAALDPDESLPGLDELLLPLQAFAPYTANAPNDSAARIRGLDAMRDGVGFDEERYHDVKEALLAQP